MPAGNATEPKFSQIESRNEGVDHANRIVICNPVIQAFRQQSRLPAISPLNEARHAHPPPIQCGNHSRHGVFTQPGSLGDMPASLADVRFYPESGTRWFEAARKANIISIDHNRPPQQRRKLCEKL